MNSTSHEPAVQGMTTIMFFGIFRLDMPDLCARCTNRQLGIFCGSNDGTLSLLDRHRMHRRFAAGDYLFHEGDAPDGLYCIETGAVKLQHESEQGNVHLLHVVQSGGVLGFKALLDGERFHGSAVALKDTQACFIPKKTFLQAIETDPKVAMAAIRKLSEEVHALEERLCHATDLTAVERVAEALLMLKDKPDAHAWKRKELADWAGTTEETVIRALGQFRDEKLIRLEGRKIAILNRRGLLEKARIVVY